jgi:hypothetical protein
VDIFVDTYVGEGQPDDFFSISNLMIVEMYGEFQKASCAMEDNVSLDNGEINLG